MPPELRVLVVDDEPRVRAGVCSVLAAEAGVAVIGEAADGLAAVEAIERLRPDLVFLDVQMPGLDGFGVLAALEPGLRPAVVFVTAFEQYALRAFDAHAIDYLCKPFDDERLLAALARARRWLERPAGPGVAALLDDVHRARGRDRFVVKHAGALRLVQARELDWIEARGNYVHLHTEEGVFLLRETLTAMVATLSAERFVRVHRSAVVAWAAVRALHKLPGGDGELELRSGARVPLGRSFRAAFVAGWRGAAGS
ncbi:MAG: response regulator transcription factor [Planctomycetes bacterium]|nr:response regulator transcription factor [Planctomycetota bacterium]